MQIENVSTLTNAKVPKKASGPSLTRNLMIGLISGLMLCALITVIALFTDTKVKTEDEIKKIFDYPIIGMIPDFEINETKKEAEEDDEE